MERTHDFDEDFLEVLLGVFLAKLRERAFGKKFSIMDDADGVAEVFDFMPVESLSQRRSRNPFMSRRSKMSSMRFFRVGSSKPFRRPKYSTISCEVRRG